MSGCCSGKTSCSFWFVVRSINRPIILSADDDENAHILLEHAFSKSKSAGSLICVDGGENVLSYLAGEPPYGERTRFPFPDLLLLDLKMPKMSGFDVLAVLQQKPELRPSRIVVFSSSGNQQDIDKAYALGCDKYVIKPTSFQSLLEFTRTLPLLGSNALPHREPLAFHSASPPVI